MCQTKYTNQGVPGITDELRKFDEDKIREANILRTCRVDETIKKFQTQRNFHQRVKAIHAFLSHVLFRMSCEATVISVLTSLLRTNSYQLELRKPMESTRVTFWKFDSLNQPTSNSWNSRR